jgi:hypothetical protein
MGKEGSFKSLNIQVCLHKDAYSRLSECGEFGKMVQKVLEKWFADGKHKECVSGVIHNWLDLRHEKVELSASLAKRLRDLSYDGLPPDITRAAFYYLRHKGVA